MLLLAQALRGLLHTICVAMPTPGLCRARYPGRPTMNPQAVRSPLVMAAFGYFFANLPQLGRHPILRRMVWRASLSSESSCRMIRTSKECYAEEDRSPEQEDVRCGHSNAHGHRCEGGRQFLSLGLRFRQTRNYERARRQTDTRRVAAARYDSDAGAGDPAAWCPKRQGNRRFAGNLVPDGGER